MVLVVLDYNRLLEWNLLYEYAREMIKGDPYGIGRFRDHELSPHETVRAINWTLQKHWQQAMKDVPDDF